MLAYKLAHCFTLRNLLPILARSFGINFKSSPEEKLNFDLSCVAFGEPRH